MERAGSALTLAAVAISPIAARREISVFFITHSLFLLWTGKYGRARAPPPIWLNIEYKRGQPTMLRANQGTGQDVQNRQSRAFSCGLGHAGPAGRLRQQ